MPGNTLSLRPCLQRGPRSGQLALLDNSAIRRLDAIADCFLVYVESDIVDNSHGVLLIEISEPAAANSCSQHGNLRENPSSFPQPPTHLYIQTDGPASRRSGLTHLAGRELTRGGAGVFAC